MEILDKNIAYIEYVMSASQEELQKEFDDYKNRVILLEEKKRRRLDKRSAIRQSFITGACAAVFDLRCCASWDYEISDYAFG
ncbi:MAG: hypothetical protein LBU11_05035 [Zoogloeaceae bacterium]|nr:hypothetical protein [Zoogloeaceae bacterium]